jgi:hypothetical protein
MITVVVEDGTVYTAVSVVLAFARTFLLNVFAISFPINLLYLYLNYPNAILNAVASAVIALLIDVLVDVNAFHVALAPNNVLLFATCTLSLTNVVVLATCILSEVKVLIAVLVAVKPDQVDLVAM